MKSIWIISDDDCSARLLCSALCQRYCVYVIHTCDTLPGGQPDFIVITSAADFALLSKVHGDVPVVLADTTGTEFRFFPMGAIRDVMQHSFSGQSPTELLQLFESFMKPPSQAEGERRLCELQTDIHNAFRTEQMGAIEVGYQNFASIYQFVERLAERSGQRVQTLLLTLWSEPDVQLTEQMRRDALSCLFQAIHITLRRNDVLTGCSDSQIMVLLMDADDDGGHLVANRISSTFLGMEETGKFKLQYDIRPIG